MNRRFFLRSAAASIALPFLPSLVPTAQAAAGDAMRMVFLYVPNGMRMEHWTPSATGANYDLPPILQPLAAIQNQVSVLTGLSNEAARVSRPGDHARGTGSFLTCRTVRYTSGADIENGVSVDQVAAQALGGETLYPSLQLGLEGGSSVGVCDSGYSCAYVRNISWAGPATPLPKLTSPITVFDRMFAGFNTEITEAERERRRTLRSSVLDHSIDEATRLHSRLGRSDKLKLDEYLNGVREVEVRIQQQQDDMCIAGTRPGSNLDVAAAMASMNELMVLSMQCDLTRYISFMLGNGGSNRSYSFIGAPGDHHENSHHDGDIVRRDRLTTIGTWEVQQFADLITRMASITEANGATLLDNSLVFFSSEIADGNSHAHTGLPVLLAGGGCGAHNPGRHIVNNDVPLANLYLSMLQAAGVPETSFGSDGDTPLVLT